MRRAFLNKKEKNMYIYSIILIIFALVFIFLMQTDIFLDVYSWVIEKITGEPSNALIIKNLILIVI